ncbi:MAG: hypothetical protein KC635_05885 [Myxococcales bacterium]|nr:hypothetical protein [Myxococcales bacterium]MCB9735688.1 hypothetical protein [Deltaproteobacteria bacterium]
MGNKALLIGALMLALLPLSSGARAQDATWFITEIQAGYAIGSAFPETPTGLETRLTGGFGGKFVNFPTRFYGVVNLTYMGLGGSGAAIDDTEIDRSWISWSFGLRTLTPIAPRLRLLLELDLGRASVSSTANVRRGREIYRNEDDSFLIELGAGLQYRFNLYFSLGARVDASIPTSFEAYDPISEIAGVPSERAGTVSPSFLISATLHL